MSSFPPEIVLAATIRDFRANHPDFETDDFIKVHNTSTPDWGIVAARLGEDGKPVYCDRTPKTTSNQTHFDQWFRDVPGINHTLIKPILLTHTADGYELKQDAFFPIDNEGFGNLPQELFRDGTLTEVGEEVLRKNNVRANFPAYHIDRNFHFTLEINTHFIYEGGNSFFEFYGDDDLWVFIDGKLVIDLGGLHESLRRRLDLTLNDSDTTLRRNLKSDLGIQHADPNLVLELVKGQPYRLDIFFAERHTVGSVFHISTSLGLESSQPKSSAPLTASIRAERDVALPTADQPSTNGIFRVALNQAAPAGGVEVSYRLVTLDSPNVLSSNATAIENVHFRLEPNIRKVTIPPGEQEADISVILRLDRPVEVGASVTIELVLDNPPTYVLQKEMQATVYFKTNRDG